MPDLFEHVHLHQHGIPLRRFAVQDALNLSVLFLFLEAALVRSNDTILYDREQEAG